MVAWSTLQLNRHEPKQIEIVKKKEKGAVYRMSGVGPGNSAVIAKRCRAEQAVVERSVYENILPQLSVNSLDYYGCVQEGDGKFWWLFLEDVSWERYDPCSEEQRVLAASWLGAMQTDAISSKMKDGLPDRGPEHYLKYLQSVLEMIPQIGALSTFRTIDNAVLKYIVSLCEHLEGHWSQVESFCNKLPRTFIHGDCLVKNVHVRMTRDGLTFTPFDWGGAGWGLPATDLGLLGLPYRGTPPSRPDYLTYAAAVKSQWPSLDVTTIQKLGNLGQLFWALKVISRGVPELDDKRTHLETAMYNFTIYASVLGNAVRSARLED